MGDVTPFRRSKYAIGQLIHHRLFDYRGVIVDVDATFAGSDEWYDSVARSRPPRDKPWYHVLVHGAAHTTYVAERNLEADHSGKPVLHPLLGRFFSRFDNGRYLRSEPGN
jgi:heat shock protein HspQ